MSASGQGAISLPLDGRLGRQGRRASTLAVAQRAARRRKLVVRAIGLGYLALLLLAPVGMIFYRTFEHGLAPVWNAVSAANGQRAFWLSLEIVAIAVPLNTVFGIGVALLLERGAIKGKALLGILIDLPFPISPVVVGLAL